MPVQLHCLCAPERCAHAASLPCAAQNLCLELATMGDLKLVERPQNYTLAAGQTKVVRANIKVSGAAAGRCCCTLVVVCAAPICVWWTLNPPCLCGARLRSTPA